MLEEAGLGRWEALGPPGLRRPVPPARHAEIPARSAGRRGESRKRREGYRFKTHPGVIHGAVTTPSLERPQEPPCAAPGPAGWGRRRRTKWGILVPLALRSLGLFLGRSR